MILVEQNLCETESQKALRLCVNIWASNRVVPFSVVLESISLFANPSLKTYIDGLTDQARHRLEKKVRRVLFTYGVQIP